MRENIYIGKINNGKYIVTKNNEPMSPKNYSKMIGLDDRTEFYWGYHGSAPTNLAFALLYESTNDFKLSKQIHQAFKSEIISKLDMELGWSLNESEIKQWLCNKEALL
jgi:lantibiotic modifying enzyme